MLRALDAELLRENQCQFGGGTAMALLFGEYRESEDIDFLVGKEGFTALRRLIAFDGMQRLFRRSITFVREPRVDQYGLRTAVACPEEGGDAAPIKFEIVFEGRIHLEPAADTKVDGSLGGVPVLCLTDLCAEKLLANSDRWADPQVFSRDLIDLAMIPGGVIPPEAVAKAESAYKEVIRREFDKAQAEFLKKEGWLGRCCEMLQIDLPPAVVGRRIRRLKLPDPPRT